MLSSDCRGGGQVNPQKVESSRARDERSHDQSAKGGAVDLEVVVSVDGVAG